MRLALVTSLLLACCAYGDSARFVPLRELSLHPAEYDGQFVRTCGQAAHWSHDNNIRVDAGKYDGPGIGVTWAPQTPRMQHAERRCVVGVVQYQGCGSEEICLHSRYDWQVIETRRPPQAPS